MEFIYMDHAATTPIDKAVTETMFPLFDLVYGNPSSVHSVGRKARQYMDKARRVMASSLQAKEKNIIFTSGGTEADNLGLIGTALANQSKGKHIITSTQEHHAVLHAAQYLEEIGFDVTYLPVYEDGKILIEDLVMALTDETILVSIMFVNNETGVIQPIEEIGMLLKEHQAYFHTDAVQAYGLLSIDVNRMGIDLLSTSAHKINGPKGIGFLYVSDCVTIAPLQFGGEQERKHRAGTENLVSIVGFQKAVELAMENRNNRRENYKKCKDKFLHTLTSNHIEFIINGEMESTIETIINISFPQMNVESLLTNFDLAGIACSSGSACTAGTIDPSHVLTAMFGEGHERTLNSVRFSFGLNNTVENSKEAALRIAEIINRLTN